MALHLGYDALRSASVEVPSAALVARLLDGGWRGPAASAFAAAWEDWSMGRAAVQASLEALTAGIATTEHEVASADGHVLEALSHLHRRLG